MNIPANAGGKGWRVYWDVPPYHTTSKFFPTLKKARGFKHYLSKAFRIKSRIRKVV